MTTWTVGPMLQKHQCTCITALLGLLWVRPRGVLDSKDIQTLDSNGCHQNDFQTVATRHTPPGRNIPCQEYCPLKNTFPVSWGSGETKSTCFCLAGVEQGPKPTCPSSRPVFILLSHLGPKVSFAQTQLSRPTGLARASCVLLGPSCWACTIYSI